jgi:hypothetical protein
MILLSFPRVYNNINIIINYFNIPKLKIAHNICLFIAFLVPRLSSPPKPSLCLSLSLAFSLSPTLHITASKSPCKLPPLLTYPLVLRVPVWKLMKKMMIPFFFLLGLLANTSLRAPSIIFPPQATL